MPHHKLELHQKKINIYYNYLVSGSSILEASSATGGTSKLLFSCFDGNDPENAPDPKLPKLRCAQSAFVTRRWLGIITAELASIDFVLVSSCKLSCLRSAVADESSKTSSAGKEPSDGKKVISNKLKESYH